MTFQKKMRSYFLISFICFIVLVLGVSTWSYFDQTKYDSLMINNTQKQFYVSQLRINAQNIYQPFLNLQVDHHIDASSIENLKESVQEAELKIQESSQRLFLLGLSENEKGKMDLIEKQLFFLKADFEKVYNLMSSYASDNHSHELQHEIVNLILYEIDYKRMYLDTSLGNFQRAAQENMILINQKQSNNSKKSIFILLSLSLFFLVSVQWFVFKQNRNIIHQIKNTHQILLNEISLMKSQTFALKNQITNPNFDKQELQKRLVETSQSFDTTTKKVLKMSTELGESFGIDTRLK